MFVIRRVVLYISLGIIIILGTLGGYCLYQINASDFSYKINKEIIIINAAIYISAPEIEMIKNNVRRISIIPFMKNYFTHLSYKTLHDREELFIGEKRIKCILLPGHTDGSMGYLVDGKFLFSGDAFRIKKGIEYIFTGSSGFIHLH